MTALPKFCMPVPTQPQKQETSAAPSGDCFEVVIKFIEDPAVLEFPDDYRVVHGNVAALRQDEAVNHAWIEEGNVAHELSNGQNVAVFKDAYYKQHRITNIRRYTVEQALSLCVKTGYYGPWE